MLVSRIFLTAVLLPPTLVLASIYMLADAKRLAFCLLRGCRELDARQP